MLATAAAASMLTPRMPLVALYGLPADDVEFFLLTFLPAFARRFSPILPLTMPPSSSHLFFFSRAYAAYVAAAAFIDTIAPPPMMPPPRCLTHITMPLLLNAIATPRPYAAALVDDYATPLFSPLTP